MGKIRRLIMCDFETTIGESSEVWLWGAMDILTLDFEWGTSIETFIEYIHDYDSIAYFHNLKFDGMFLLDYYLKHGIKPVTDKKINYNEMKCIISDTGLFYQIIVSCETRIEYRDSLKLIPLSVAEIPKAYGINISKLEMDYSEHITGGENEPTDDDLLYLRHDCEIVARALKVMIDQGMNRLTLGSNALAWYKKCNEDFKKYFPKLTPIEDKDIRRAYKGGWTYCNPKYQRQMVGAGSVFDVNSMYPWAMRYNRLPFGHPVYFEGKYKADKLYPLWIACIEIDCKIKEGCFPSIQLKNNPRYISTEYIQETDGPTLLYVTNIDFELIKDTYNIRSLKWIAGYKFMAKTDMFDTYIDHWYSEKEKHGKEGNAGLKTIDKFMLNMLYGKFGTNPRKDLKVPYIDDNMVKFRIVEMPEKYDGYIPVAAFITSYCRDKIIRAAVACGDRFLYADTDSLHILGAEEPDIEIDPYRLGAFKKESEFSEAMYYRPKLYIETINGKLEKKAGGLPAACRDNLTYETMVEGATFEGKLMPKTVPGGVVLVPHDYVIRG